MADLVFNIRAASASDIRNLASHEANRSPDGSSRIDPGRSHLNRVLLGPATQQDALDELFESGVQRPAAQAEAPYVQMVLGAGPAFFRPFIPGEGRYEIERVETFAREAMGWLQETFGQDLIHVSLHLDEVTPHLHALVAPTYERKARKPGRQRKDETTAEFEARQKAAAERVAVRTVGRASHPLLSQPSSFRVLRKALASHLEPLGIQYGQDRAVDAPAPRTTMEWVKDEAQAARQSLEELQAQLVDAQGIAAALESREIALAEREAATDQEAKFLEIATQNLRASVSRAVKGTLNEDVPAEQMAKRPEATALMKARAPGERLTWGFWLRFLALNFSNTGDPVPCRPAIRKALEQAFDQVAAWAKAIEKTLIRAEDEAARILKEARDRVDIPAAQSWAALVELIKAECKAEMGDAYQKLADRIDRKWAHHPANPERPIQRQNWHGPGMGF